MGRKGPQVYFGLASRRAAPPGRARDAGTRAVFEGSPSPNSNLSAARARLELHTAPSGSRRRDASPLWRRRIYAAVYGRPLLGILPETTSCGGHRGRRPWTLPRSSLCAPKIRADQRGRKPFDPAIAAL